MTTPTTLKPATFAPPKTFGVGSNPLSVAVGDFNSDGNADVVIANFGSDDVSVLMGNGRGYFAAKKTFFAGTSPWSVSVTDVNGDGNADVVTANRDSSNISVLMGDGRGNFAAQTTFSVNYSPVSMGIGDVNNDGNVDVVTANYGNNNVSVLVGDGQGNFAVPTNFAVGSLPYSVSVADVNGDGNTDVVTANTNSNDVSVLVGDGLGNFAEQTTFAAGYHPESVSVVDVNRDGKVDMVTAYWGGVAVLVGDGRSNFAAPTTFALETTPEFVGLADVNGDGNADVVTANYDSNNVSVLVGDDKGSFAEQAIFLVGKAPHSVTFGDFNGDGKTDLVTTNSDSNNISVLLNTTEGTFVAPSKPDVKPVVVAPVPVIEKPVVVTPPTVAFQHSPTGKIQISGNGIQDETLSIQNTLNDADGLSASTPLFRYQWLQNGKAISGATQSTYTLSENDIGTAISVKVSYTDGLNKLETATSSATDLIEPKPEEILPPTYALTIDKTSVNEGDTVTFKLVTENVDADTEIPFKFGSSISNADVLGGLKTNSFVVDANGKASLAVKFLADKFTEGAENLTLTLNSGESQSVAVKDSSVTPAPVVKPVEVVPVVVKPVVETSTGSKGYDKKAVILSGDKLIGGEKNDTLTGNVGKDELLGKAGNDKLIGLGGNDTLIGESGNDDLNGGEGLDSLSGGSGNDLLDGGNGNDTLQGDQGNDTLKGGVGVDNMDGGDGDDYYFVDNSKDVVSEVNKNTLGGNDTIESTSTYTLGKNIENLILASIDNNAGKGNELNNQITGNIGDNKLEGMAGNDQLLGGDGADTLDGGKGKDTLIGGNDDDIYMINNDFDTVTEEKNGGEQDQIWASVDYDLNQSLFVEVLQLSGTAVTGVGNDANNLLMEVENGKVANHFYGNGGDDTISSEGGNDTIEGGAGDDSIDGGDGTQDLAIFYSKKENYQITRNPDAEGVDQITVRYVGNGENDEMDEGTDILTNIELLQFADYDFNNPIHTDTIQITGLPA